MPSVLTNRRMRWKTMRAANATITVDARWYRILKYVGLVRDPPPPPPP